MHFPSFFITKKAGSADNNFYGNAKIFTRLKTVITFLF